MPTLPLEGVRVLEPGQLLAAPFATSLMGDFGAEVIHLEMPGVGDGLRALGPFYKGKSLWWKTTARNKKCITLDLRLPRGQELFKRLAEKSDVVLENFRAGVMEEWGLGWDVLHSINPRLIMVRQTGFGQTGPYARRASFGNTVEAYAGLTNMMGYADTPPVASGLGDHLAALSIVYGTMFALYHRDVHGAPGQLIDNSASESIIRLIGETSVPAAGLGLPQRPKALSTQPAVVGNFGDFRVTGRFKAKDGKWCTIITSTRPIWDRFMKALGREDFLDEASYPEGSPARTARGKEVLDYLTSWFASHTRDEVLDLAEKYEATIGPVYDMPSAMADRHFKARKTFIEVEDPDFGTLQMVNVQPRLHGSPGRIAYTGPSIGKHNDEIYRGLLGLTDPEMDLLKSAKVI